MTMSRSLRQRFNEAAEWVLIVLCAPALGGGAVWLIHFPGGSHRIPASWLSWTMFVACLGPSAFWMGHRLFFRHASAEHPQPGEWRKRVTARAIIAFGLAMYLSFWLMVHFGIFVSCYMGDCI